MNADGTEKKQLTNDGDVYDSAWTVDTGFLWVAGVLQNMVMEIL